MMFEGTAASVELKPEIKANVFEKEIEIILLH
jgi:hypothetical protein